MRPILFKKVLHVQLNWDLWVAFREVLIKRRRVRLPDLSALNSLTQFFEVVEPKSKTKTCHFFGHNKHETAWQEESKDKIWQGRRKILSGRCQIALRGSYISKIEQHKQNKPYNISSMVPDSILLICSRHQHQNLKEIMNKCMSPTVFVAEYWENSNGANICHLHHVTSTLTLHHRTKPLYGQL